MLYKIALSDLSFIVADENYKLCLFKHSTGRPHRVSVSQLLKTNKYKNYFLMEKQQDQTYNPVLLSYKIEPYDLDTELIVGGRYKMSQDIRVGDLVLGENGEPDEVVDLHSGNEELYELCIDGETIIVNAGHILHLKDKETDEEIDIPVNIFLHMSEEFQDRYVMVRSKDGGQEHDT